MIDTVIREVALEIESDINKINRAVSEIVQMLNKSGDEITYFAINEMLSNAIEHGNRYDIEKRVNVKVFINYDYYRVVITDQGKGFNWRQYFKENIDLEGSSDRGRGIIMTKMMCYSLDYNNKGNEVTITNLFCT